jgi:hypothetical protein
MLPLFKYFERKRSTIACIQNAVYIDKFGVPFLTFVIICPYLRLDIHTKFWWKVRKEKAT